MDAEFWPRHPSKITATSSPGHLFTIKGKRKRDYFLKIWDKVDKTINL